MRYNYKLTGVAASFVIAGSLLLSGCEYDERARKQDEEANIRLAARDIGRQMGKAEKGMRKLEDFVRKIGK